MFVSASARSSQYFIPISRYIVVHGEREGRLGPGLDFWRFLPGEGLAIYNHAPESSAVARLLTSSSKPRRRLAKWAMGSDTE